jgi:hypothetical protein
VTRDVVYSIDLNSWCGCRRGRLGRVRGLVLDLTLGLIWVLGWLLALDVWRGSRWENMSGKSRQKVLNSNLTSEISKLIPVGIELLGE